MSAAGGSRRELAKTLADLHQRLVAASLPLRVADAEEALRLRNEMIGQLTDYVLPRLAHQEAPLVAVVGGSTGTGKSTLVNSLVGRQVSAPGVLRPTTRSAVVAHHPDDAAWFSGGHILPGFTRTTTGNAEPGTLRLVADTALPRGLALVDTPDIDSVVTGNRELANQLLSAADLWLFVTSGMRYADAVPWGYLRTAAERSVAVAVVLDRVDRDRSGPIRRHLAQMLDSHGLGDAPLFVVAETILTKQGLLPADDLGTVKAWLAKLAGEPTVRAAVVQQTLDGVVRSFVDRVPRYADALDTQLATAEHLRAAAERFYGDAVDAVGLASRDGSMLRGEVLARWQEFVGTGEIVRSLEAQIGRSGGAGQHDRRGPGDNLAQALEDGFAALVVNAADHAAEAVGAAWRQDPAGQTLLAERIDLGRSAPDVSEQARLAFRTWQERLSSVVAASGDGDTKRADRLLSFGPGGLALVLIIAVFTADETAGPGEGTTTIPVQRDAPEQVETSARSSDVARRVLEAVFGARVVDELVTAARDDLRSRVHEVMDQSRSRYDAMLDALGFEAVDVQTLRETVRSVEATR